MSVACALPGPSFVVARRRPLALAVALLSLLALLGCGGGGGGGAGGTGSDPVEVEIRAELDAFVAAVATKDADAAMARCDSNLQVFKKGATIPDNYTALRQRLVAFFAAATAPKLTLVEFVAESGEDSAVAHGTWELTWTDAGGAARTLREAFQIRYDRIARWGIRVMAGPADTFTLEFPPAG